MTEHLNFRGKQWERNGNHYRLVGTQVRVYFWNTGAKQTYMIEVLGLSVHSRNMWTIPGKGADARDKAIKMAFELANK